MEVLAARATTLVAFATVLVTVSSPVFSVHVNPLTTIAPVCARIQDPSEIPLRPYAPGRSGACLIGCNYETIEFPGWQIRHVLSPRMELSNDTKIGEIRPIMDFIWIFFVVPFWQNRVYLTTGRRRRNILQFWQRKLPLISNKCHRLFSCTWTTIIEVQWVRESPPEFPEEQEAVPKALHGEERWTTEN